jgi:mannitol/fructose-specific phosphotransferase system IIA component (Ntr-type)
MDLTELLSERLIAVDLKATGKLAVIDELAHLIARVHDEVNPDQVSRALLDRERISSTALGRGVAIPHAKIAAADAIVGCLGLSRLGIDFDSEDGQPTRIFFALVAPKTSTGEHLKVLARIARLCQSDGFTGELLEADGAREAHEVIREAEARL